jgi:hypothetical protein
MFLASSHYSTSTGTKESVETVLLLYYLLVDVSFLLSLQYRHQRKSVETVLLLLYYILLMFLSSAHYSTGIEEEVLRQFCFFITYLYSEA